MTAQELMAKGMYDDWKSRERVVKPEWDDAGAPMQRVFLRKAEAALKAVEDILSLIAEDADGGASARARLEVMGFLP